MKLNRDRPDRVIARHWPMRGLKQGVFRAGANHVSSSPSFSLFPVFSQSWVWVLSCLSLLCSGLAVLSTLLCLLYYAYSTLCTLSVLCTLFSVLYYACCHFGPLSTHTHSLYSLSVLPSTLSPSPSPSLLYSTTTTTTIYHHL